MLRADGAVGPPIASACGDRGVPDRRHPRGDGTRRADRVARRVGRDRHPGRRRHRDPRRNVRRLSQVPKRLLMLSTLFSTPRPEPGHTLPAAAGTLLLLLAVPVFLVTGWPLAGLGLAAALWIAVHALDLFLARARK